MRTNYREVQGLSRKNPQTQVSPEWTAGVYIKMTGSLLRLCMAEGVFGILILAAQATSGG
jgi:hypothetical protein